MNKINYDRAIEIAKNVMNWMVYDSSDSSEDYDTFSNECDINDDELVQLGFGYMISENIEEDI